MKVALLTTDSREHYRDYGAPRPYFGTAPSALLDGFIELGEPEIHIVSCLQQRVQSPQKLAPNIWYHGLHVPKWGWLRTGYAGCLRATRRTLKQLQPDLVHAQGTERDCGFCGVLSGYPAVLTIHGNMRRVAAANRSRPFSYNWLMARFETFVVPRATGVVCITSYTQSMVGREARHSWLVPNAVDAAFFDVRREPVSPPVLLCVGTVCLHKNQNFLIRALDSVAGCRKFELRFLGSASEADPYGREFLGLVRARPWCAHAGFAGRSQLREELARAALLVLPSLEDNCPMVVLEAAAAGVPVVAVRVGGVPDLVEDGRTGRLVAVNDGPAFARAVDDVLGSPVEAEGLAKAAKASARARFHPTVIAMRHLEVYREVLSSRS